MGRDIGPHPRPPPRAPPPHLDEHDGRMGTADRLDEVARPRMAVRVPAHHNDGTGTCPRRYALDDVLDRCADCHGGTGISGRTAINRGARFGGPIGIPRGIVWVAV